MIKRILLFFVLFYTLQLRGQHFEDVASDQGISVQHEYPLFNVLITVGACWFDCDGDGDLDLFVVNTVGNHLYRNNRIGEGTSDFTDIASGDLFNAEFGGSAVAAADYDNDGDNDLYLANYHEDALLENDGEGNFTNVTAIAFPSILSLVPGYGTTVSWGDLNNDGWLDLYVGNYTFDQNSTEFSSDYLFISNGGNSVTFTDRSDLLSGDHDDDDIEDLKGFSWASIMTDYNNDGWLDIYTTNDCPHDPEDNKLWKNNGDLNFAEVSQAVGPFTRGKVTRGGQLPDCFNAMGITRGDVNNDGYLDYHMSNIHDYGENTVLLLNREGRFENASYSAGLDENIFKPVVGYLFTWGTLFFDYDLDGWLDLTTAGGSFISPIDMPNFLYHNELNDIGGIPTFIEIDKTTSGISNNLLSRTVIVGDFDMDFDPDLFLTNLNSVPSLYRNNNNNGNNALVISLVGAGPPLSNLNGIGSKVYLTTPDKLRQFREVHSGSGLGGGDDMACYFGMSEYAHGDIEIIWPSGIRQHIGAVSSNQRITVREPKLGISWPSGNEVLLKGSTQVIYWKSVFDEPVNIILAKANEERIILAELEMNDGAYEWQISTSFGIASDYRIIIESAVNDTQFGESNDSFTIIDADTNFNALIWPNGGELINQEDTVIIAWERNLTEFVSIQLLLGGEEYLNIAELVPNSGTYEWIVPDSIQGNGFEINILPNVGFSDKSDYPFAITKYSHPEPRPDEPDPQPEDPDPEDPEPELTVTSIRASSGKFALAAYPNPFLKGTTLKYRLETEALVSFQIFTFVGNNVIDVATIHQSAGIQELLLPTDSLKQGVYLVRMMVNGIPGSTIRIVKKG